MLREHFGKLLEQVRAAAVSHYGEKLVSVAVFGSVARGAMRPDSDIDLLFVVEPLPQGRLARMRDFCALEAQVEQTLKEMERHGIHTSLSPIIKTPAEVRHGSLLFLDMVDQARILFDRDNFLRDYLRELGQRLKALGSKRVYLRGGYYWILKPDLKPGEEIVL